MKILIAIISPSFLCGFVEALYSCTIIMPAESKKGTKPVVYLRGKTPTSLSGGMIKQQFFLSGGGGPF